MTVVKCSWDDVRSGCVYEFDEPVPEVEVSDNPVVHELLGPDGKVIRQWRQRPPIGFARAVG